MIRKDYRNKQLMLLVLFCDIHGLAPSCSCAVWGVIEGDMLANFLCSEFPVSCILSIQFYVHVSLMDVKMLYMLALLTVEA